MANLGRTSIQLIVPLTVLAAALTLWVHGAGEGGVREALRVTARVSLIAFVLAFIARPMHEIAASSLSAWLLKNRKLIGICFGLSLLAHIVLIFALFAVQHPDWPAIIGPLDIAIGGPGLLIVMAMTITSFSVVRKRMSPSAWKWLHTSGLYFVWFIFTACLISSYLDKSPPSPSWHYTPLIGLLLLAILIRIGAGLRRLTSNPGAS